MSRAIELLLADQANTKQDFKVDWKENSKLDFVLEEPLPVQTLVTEEDAEPADVAKFNATDMYFGTGNKSANYVLEKNETQGLEIGVKVHKRGGPGYALPVSQTEDGFFEYEVPAEPLLTTVPGSDPRRVRWAYDFSIVTGLDDVDSSIADFQFEMAVDFDPADTVGQTESIKMSFDGKGNWVDVKSGQKILVPDANVDARGADRKVLEQNSLNIGYAALDVFRPIELDPLWAEKEGSYHFTLTATLGGKTVLEHKIIVRTDPEFAWTI